MRISPRELAGSENLSPVVRAILLNVQHLSERHSLDGFLKQGTTRVRILCVLVAYFHLCAINFPLWPAFMLCVCESCLNVHCTGKQTQTVEKI